MKKEYKDYKKRNIKATGHTPEYYKEYMRMRRSNENFRQNENMLNISRCKKYRENWIKFIQDILGSECEICKYDKCWAALDIHHNGEKTIAFANWLHRPFNEKYKEIIKNELKDCRLLCCRCHREYHAGFIKFF
jgi:hypothetical protein